MPVSSNVRPQIQFRHHPSIIFWNEAMLRLVSLLAITVLSGCATTTVKEFQGPDGRAIKTVKCTSDPSKCFGMASQNCPNGGTYRVISSESHAGGIAADFIPGPITWYSMTFSCGLSDGKMPDFNFAGQQYIPPALAPSPIVIKQQPSTTNCTKIGNTTNCTTY